MTETIVSARGMARCEVSPDHATLYLQLNVLHRDSSEARAQLLARLSHLSEDLEGSGVIVATAGDAHSPATYLRHRLSVSRSKHWNNDSRQWDLTNDYVATASITVTIRDFGLLNTVTKLATDADADVSGPRWAVDADNLQWRAVRKQAVRESFLQAQDYADALGGEVIGLQHLAEPGLLGTDGAVGERSAAARPGSAPGSNAVEEIDLTPVPQILTATVEARYLVRATDIVAALTA